MDEAVSEPLDEVAVLGMTPKLSRARFEAFIIMAHCRRFPPGFRLVARRYLFRSGWARVGRGE